MESDLLTPVFTLQASTDGSQVAPYGKKNFMSWTNSTPPLQSPFEYPK